MNLIKKVKNLRESITEGMFGSSNGPSHAGIVHANFHSDGKTPIKRDPHGNITSDTPKKAESPKPAGNAKKEWTVSFLRTWVYSGKVITDQPGKRKIEAENSQEAIEKVKASLTADKPRTKSFKIQGAVQA